MNDDLIARNKPGDLKEILELFTDRQRIEVGKQDTSGRQEYARTIIDYANEIYYHFFRNDIPKPLIDRVFRDIGSIHTSYNGKIDLEQLVNVGICHPLAVEVFRYADQQDHTGNTFLRMLSELAEVIGENRGIEPPSLASKIETKTIY